MEILLIAFAVISLMIFIDVQKYLSDPLRHQKRDEWFEKFATYNRHHQRDPALAWRLTAIDQAFHKHQG